MRAWDFWPSYIDLGNDKTDKWEVFTDEFIVVDYRAETQDGGFFQVQPTQYTPASPDLRWDLGRWDSNGFGSILETDVTTLDWYSYVLPTV